MSNLANVTILLQELDAVSLTMDNTFITYLFSELHGNLRKQVYVNFIFSGGSSSSGPFIIDSRSGQIRVSSRLDFESTPLHVLDVEVSDGTTTVRPYTI